MKTGRYAVVNWPSDWPIKTSCAAIQCWWIHQSMIMDGVLQRIAARII